MPGVQFGMIIRLDDEVQDSGIRSGLKFGSEEPDTFIRYECQVVIVP